MAQTLNPLDVKVAPDFTFGTALAAGAAKVATEKLLARWKFVGNGTFRSGIIKGVLAFGINKGLASRKGVVGFAGQAVSTGMAIDAVEDMVAAALRMIGGNSSSDNGRPIGNEPAMTGARTI